MVSQCYAKLGDGMVDGDQCHAKLRDRLYSLGKWKWYHSVMQNWDHLHNSQGKWYHCVTETMGPFYITDCEKDITVLWRMLGPFTRWHHNVLQTLGPFTWREGEWYHSVMQNLQITYTTARGNGITVWCKTLGPFTQHPEEMVTQCYTNWRTIYTMPWENRITFWGKTLGPKLWHTQHPK